MDTFVMFAVAATWTAIIGMLAWGAATSWRRVMSGGDTLPIFGMLERRGLVLERLQRSPDTLYGAVRRCAMCRERSRCADWMAGRSRPRARVPERRLHGRRLARVMPLGFLDTALLFLGAALAGILFATAYLWRRLQADARELPVRQLLRRPGAPALAAHKIREAELRCMLCPSQRDCRQRILTGAPAPSYCPNDSLFQAKGF